MGQWVCEGAFDALALLAAGVPRVVAIFAVHGGRWVWAREVRELVFALDADLAGQQQWRALVREAALRGKHVAVLPPGPTGGTKTCTRRGWPGCSRSRAHPQRVGRATLSLRTSRNGGPSARRS